MLKEMPKKGDKVRYTGGIDAYYDSILTRGKEYAVEYVDSEGDAVVIANHGNELYIQEQFNFGEFELVEASEELDKGRTERDLIVELAYNYVKLAQRVEFLEDSLVEAHKKADSVVDNVEMIVDDVVMLDERTMGAAAKPNPAVEEKVARTKDDILRRIQASYE